MRAFAQSVREISVKSSKVSAIASLRSKVGSQFVALSLREAGRLSRGLYNHRDLEPNPSVRFRQAKSQEKQLNEQEAVDLVMEKTGGDPEVAVMFLGIVLDESEKSSRAGTGGLTMPTNLLNAFIRLAQKSGWPILNARLATFVAAPLDEG